MNPVICIPTYWCRDASRCRDYDHATELADPQPDLERCLASLEQVPGISGVVVLLAADPDVADEARSIVNDICAAHLGLNPLVIGVPEARMLQNQVIEIAKRLTGECVSLRGYGAIRNLGLVAAAVLGHDVIIFLDDDEVVLGDDFLEIALYGLGARTRQNLPILAKSGYFIDEAGSYLAQSNKSFANAYWDQSEAFNEWMSRAQNASRISRSNHMCGGVMALHARVFTQVAFDPFITRGEDLDYLFNLRLYGYDVWFDNKWCVKHLPPQNADDALRFKQNVYRWVYEREKLARMVARLDFVQVTPASLMPYPGVYMGPDLERRIHKTAWRRALTRSSRKEYIQLARRGYADALVSAKSHDRAYLSFQSWWSSIMQGLAAKPELGQWLIAEDSLREQKLLYQAERGTNPADRTGALG